MAASKDGSESVDDFLARISSLNSKQGEEEAERSRRMEEEMLQARKERQARRAERARSLSPSKTGPTPSLRLVGESTPKSRQAIEPPVALTPPLQSRTLGRAGASSPKSGRTPVSSLDFSRPSVSSLSEEPSMPSPPTNATALSRSGTLSWKQRPLSRGTGSFRARPQSVASLSDTSLAPKLSHQKDAEEMSRQDIAASLGVKDPAFFRQTADRGLGSAAYRKNDSDADRPPSFAQGSLRLPGMSNGTGQATERSKDFEPAGLRESLPTIRSPPALDQRRAHNLGAGVPARPLSVATSTPTKSPMLDLPAFKPLDLTAPSDPDVSSLDRTSSVLRSDGRPLSPTKGLGGFVESAMMKRSDSVNKRWSVQANAGLKRGDSIAGSRPPHLSGVSGFSPGHSRNTSKDARMEGNSSPLSSSRPVSSHGVGLASVTRGRPLPLPEESEAVFAPAPSVESQTKERMPTESPNREPKELPMTPPPLESPLGRSPSKTMDPRRWSPTKASWLESALNKPDTSRFTAAKPEVPAWKLNMQRSKFEQQPQVTESAAIADIKTATPSKPRPQKTTSPERHHIAHAEREDSPPRQNVKKTRAPEVSQVEQRSTPAAEESVLNKIEEKPAVPSKRNITPVQQQSSPDVASPASLKADSKSETKPPAVKPKPQTPPKTDFRASLKSRQGGAGTSNETEPEFKAVFGKLKRAQTQNYVAPDVLKNNITKGKAALNTTGGPQKSNRVDELKESILQKKEAMKAAGGSPSRRPETSVQEEKPAEPVPEALARRKTLHRTAASTEKVDVVKMFDPPAKASPSAAALTPSEKPTPSKEDSLPPREDPAKKSSGTSQAKLMQNERAEVSARPVSPEKFEPKQSGKEKAESKVEPISVNSFKTMLPDNSKLAARLNPALAGILSRSGSPKLPGDSASNGNSELPVRETEQASRKGAADSSQDLTHMTKARAKGPKRRAPKASSSSKEATELDVQKSEAPSASTRAEKTSTQDSFRENPAMITSQPLNALKGIAEKFNGSAKSTEASSSPLPKPKPPVANKSMEVRKVSSTGTPSMKDSPAPAKSPSPKKFEVLNDRTVPVFTPPELDGVRETAPITPRKASNRPLTPSTSKLNTTKPPRPLPDSPAKPTTVTPSKISGLGLQLGSATKGTAAAPVLTPPPEREFASNRAEPSPRKGVSPSKSSSFIKPRLEGFFGILPQARDAAEFDTEKFLSSQRKPQEKSRTLSNQIWEVTGDGKRTAMPPQQEHILFEDCMYLSVHSMQSSNGSKTSGVYLWSGDEVPEAAVEDAQLFCRRIARDNNAKLEVVRQGKESSEFFQALGGIVIVRRNKSSALYMLCGRRHLGHVAFDEVELSSSSLSSGFPFLISAKFAKFYLWKGVGADQEDVGCARLIGMDLGLTGEIEEVTEGEEPSTFWEAFPSRSPRKPSTGKGASPSQARSQGPKLYRLEHDRPKSAGNFWGLRSASPPKQSNVAVVEEIAPFNQRDLDSHNIHLLDMYDEVYVLVGATARKPAEFVTAIRVAEEIAVLAPSIQDRPVLPVCYVVLGDPPQKVKDVFRKWRPDRSATQVDPLCVRVDEILHELGITM
ncbi:hypothetical protein EDD36DRAFT_196112 [Exophiala viscosa]|uniref:DUF4045 domain-containing protein n=1 Tax=Exophiala viscosa TaxID=2486360 RepID=A0AAN6E030_9EURO|nr:hypothetical protein EDD36DRAFT_196112 [Exophiala viscosa]